VHSGRHAACPAEASTRCRSRGRAACDPDSECRRLEA
jgi:hypothetical protein